MPWTFFSRTFGNNTGGGGGGGTPPTAPTLAVSDNADGTGGVATISGGDAGSTHTVQSQTVDGELGTATWTTRGSRAGNGTVNVAPGNGYYWWRVVASNANGTSLSNLVYQPLTSGVQALYERILVAVQARIQTLSLTGIASGSILLRKVPWDRDIGTAKTYAYPVVQVSPHGQETMVPTAGTNQKDDVGYAVLVSMMDIDNQRQTYQREQRLRWREAIARTFRHARLPGISEVFDCVVEPNVVVHAPNWLDQNLWTSFLVLRFVARESRGFGT